MDAWEKRIHKLEQEEEILERQSVRGDEARFSALESLIDRRPSGHMDLIRFKEEWKREREDLIRKLVRKREMKVK
jgi:hypothetical protein